MTVKATSPALNLRSLLNRLAGMKPAPRSHTFWFSGTGSQTVFALPSGWCVKNVFVGGAIFRPGVGEDYSISPGAYADTVTFAVAPGLVDVAIIAEAGA